MPDGSHIVRIRLIVLYETRNILLKIHYIYHFQKPLRCRISVPSTQTIYYVQRVYIMVNIYR